MKVKSLLLMGVIALTLVSCDAIKDASSIDIETSLGVDVPVTSNDMESLIMKSVNLEPGASYPFSGEKQFSLSENPDISSHISSITGIELKSGSVLFPGFSSGNVINSLTIEIMNGAGIQVLTRTFENITEGSYSLTEADVLALSAFATQLEETPDENFTFKLKGTADYPINALIKLKYGALVKASVLSI